MYDELEMLEMEDFEDFEEYEDYEDFEDFENYEDFEEYEDAEDFEEYEDFEADPFFGRIAKAIARKARKVPWKKVVGTAATSGMGVGKKALGSYLKKRGWHFESQEAEDEMAYMAELAAEAESEAEADAFIGSIAGLAGSLLPMLMKESDSEYEDFEDYEAYEDFEDYEDYEDLEGDQFLGALAAKFLPHAIPLLKKGIKGIGKALRESDPSGQAVKTLPTIAKVSAKKLAKQAKAGKPVTKKTVAKVLTTTTKKVVANPKTVAKVIKKNRTAAKRAVVRAKATTKQTKKVLRQKRLMRAH